MSEAASRHLWTIVLAGGEGVRLRPLTRALHGDDCPKQFAMISGERSLLQATVERARRWSAPERIAVVVADERESMARRQLAAHRSVDVVAQPSNRGTGPGILLPLARIMAFDPNAHVVILPSDHYVRDEAPFERSIRTAIAASGDQVALVGAVPDHAETQYGWIALGGPLASAGARTVENFCEKPSATLAARLFASGALWNTFVMAGPARQFWSLGVQHLPAAVSQFELYQDAVNGSDEARVLREVYRHLPCTGDQVAAAQAERADLGAADRDVVGAGQVAVGAQPGVVVDDVEQAVHGQVGAVGVGRGGGRRPGAGTGPGGASAPVGGSGGAAGRRRVALVDPRAEVGQEILLKRMGKKRSPSAHSWLPTERPAAEGRLRLSVLSERRGRR